MNSGAEDITWKRNYMNFSISFMCKTKLKSHTHSKIVWNWTLIALCSRCICMYVYAYYVVLYSCICHIYKCVYVFHVCSNSAAGCDGGGGDDGGSSSSHSLNTNKGKQHNERLQIKWAKKEKKIAHTNWEMSKTENASVLDWISYCLYECLFCWCCCCSISFFLFASSAFAVCVDCFCWNNPVKKCRISHLCVYLVYTIYDYLF